MESKFTLIFEVKVKVEIKNSIFSDFEDESNMLSNSALVVRFHRPTNQSVVFMDDTDGLCFVFEI